MPEVLFVKTVRVRDENYGTDKERGFAAGHIYNLEEPSVRHWTDRNVATVNPERIKEAKDGGAKVQKSPATLDADAEAARNAAPSTEEEHPTNARTATSTTQGGTPEAASQAGPGADITAGAGAEGKNDAGQQAVAGETNPKTSDTSAAASRAAHRR